MTEQNPVTIKKISPENYSVHILWNGEDCDFATMNYQIRNNSWQPEPVDINGDRHGFREIPFDFDKSKIIVRQLFRKWNNDLTKKQLEDLVFHFEAAWAQALYTIIDVPKKEKKEKKIEDLMSDEPLTIDEDATKEMGSSEIQDVLGTTVKQDNVNKTITFATMTLTYTDDSQANISNRSISASGKSYIPLELIQVFPQEDVIKIAYASPSSFYHDAAIWDEENNILRMNLERKILIFIDQPHDELLRRLRPLLSHDDRELDVKITDKSEKHGLRTKTVRIRGFPTVIFCTGSLKMDEQEGTRNFLLSPELTQEKLRASVVLKIQRECDKDAFSKMVDADPRRQLLRRRIALIKKAKVRYIIVDEIKVQDAFLNQHKQLRPRHTRDVGRLVSLIKFFALFNLWHRERRGEDLVASDADIENGFKLWGEIAASQDLGITPYVYRLFKEIIEPLAAEKPQGITRKELIARHFQVYGRGLPDWQMRQEILPTLESVSLIYEETNPDNKRERLIFVSPTPLNSPYCSQPAQNTLTDIVSGTRGEAELEGSNGDIVSGSGVSIKIKLKKSTPAFVGSDLKTYGPYQKDGMVELPLKEAEILVRRGFAEEVIKND